MLEQPRIITLTTDFGSGSPYVAQMKAVILSIQPSAALVDVTHTIPPQDVRCAALVLEDNTPFFPVGTVHVAVVDPLVGSPRQIVATEIGDQYFVGPDNGLFSRLIASKRPQRIVSVTVKRFWMKSVSNTFHGRDIMAPVAAHLAKGVAIDELGDEQATIETLDWPQPQISDRAIQGEIWYVDSFGNLITNITKRELNHIPNDASLTIFCADRQTSTLAEYYGQHPAGTLIGLVGSNGRLELAEVNGNAATFTKAAVGCPVNICW